MDNQNLPHKNSRVCCVCSKTLHGRSDKVFCDIGCKNKYHSQMRKENKTETIETIKIALRNYQILCYLQGSKSNKFEISRLELERMGFDFNIVTSFEQTRFGIKLFLFSFTWYQTSNRKIVVSRDENHSPIAPYLYRRWKIHYQKFEQTIQLPKKE